MAARPVEVVGVLVLFAIAIFCGAALLFCVQPMLARMILPGFGGSPAVWTASMLFFQAALLAGYALAHGLGAAGRRRPRLAAGAHALVAAGSLLVLPVAIPALSGGVAGAWPPAMRVIGVLVLAVGGPYLVLATLSPMLQRWIAASEHRLATNPYPLYAASNAGSLLGLLAYPFVIEPLLPLDAQRRWWSIAYAAVVALALVSAVVAMVRSRGARAEEKVDAGDTLTLRSAAGWALLAFVPSSLLLGVTQHVTTDVAAAPLLWVVPLAIYLLTFVIAFGTTRPGLLRWTARLAPIGVAALAVAMLLRAREPLAAVVVAHLAGFGLCAMLCHARLAALRPPASGLTAFYLLVATGGAMGGVFNALVAPRLFDGVLEYPLMIGAAMLALPIVGVVSRRLLVRDAVVGVVVAGGFLVLLLALLLAGGSPLAASSALWERAVVVGLPVIGLYLLHQRPAAFGVSVAGVLVVAQLWPGSREVLHAERTFFGVHVVERRRVPLDGGGVATFHELRHGSTTHGVQRVDAGGVAEPLAYYHDRSPIAEVFALIDGQATADPHTPLDRVALVGLGTGAVAAYGRRGMRIVGYEIDPEVVAIARDPRYFTFVSGTRADFEAVVGDGRLSLAAYTGEPFDLIVLDAFSSDAIPVHLLTVEAFELYLDRLSADGVLAVHISNVYLDLEPVVAAAAERLGLAATMRVDPWDEAQSARTGRYTSTWVVLGRREAAIGPLVGRPRWREPVAPEGFRAWTDDYSNLLSVLGRPAGQ
ncbi:MAG: fused MFS/spermidine synthase [Planctomycetota bacterium]